MTEIGLEFIPSPIEKYTKDRSAMDAYIKFLDNKGGRHLIAVETKYTDELGVNEASHCEEQKQMLIDTRLFDSEFEELLLDGKVKLTQVYRNFLLTERYRIVEGLKDSFSSERFIFSSSFSQRSSFNRRGNQVSCEIPETGVCLQIESCNSGRL